MKKIFNCRRSSIGLIGMLLLFIIALVNKTDISSSLAMICMGVAASNAYEGKKHEPKN